ncbi:hypothetical protein ONZ45_g14439 [Pleurotus djamor]|nr:hypothetical protein ONZ45_g14439 [Pleurotus djamor]
MSLCKDCIKGVTHEGTPAGKWEVLNGVETYVATPEIEYPKDKAVLFMTDIFGPRMINIQLLADDYARNGFKVYVPDIVNGDPVPTAILSGNTSISIPEWLKDHGPEQTTPTVEKAIAALRAQGMKEIGACGFCFGARYCFNVAFAGELKVAVVSHPSLLEIADIEKYSKTNVPLLVNSCEFDDLFSDDVRDGFDQALGGDNFAPGYKRTYFEGCAHGFSVRGDLSNPKVLAGKEGAFKASIEWLLKYL